MMALTKYRVIAAEDFIAGDKLTLVPSDYSVEIAAIEARHFNPETDFCEVGMALKDAKKNEPLYFLADEIGIRVESKV